MPTEISTSEKAELLNIANKIQRIRDFLSKHSLSTEGCDLIRWYDFLAQVKDLFGNFNNDLSFMATLLIKPYPGIAFDAASKSQSAPGLDIDILTPDGKRIVGEVKTVYPYNETDFGSAQRESFFQDFAKLAKAQADRKYLFLAEPRAFEVVQAKYRDGLGSVTVVSLTEGKEFKA